MRSSCIVSLLALALVSSSVGLVEAQPIRTVTTEMPETPSTVAIIPGTTGTLQALCERAAGDPALAEYRPFGSAVHCELRSARHRRLAAFSVVFSGGLYLYLCARERAELRILHLLERVDWLPTEGGAASIVGISESDGRSGDRLIAIETRTEFIDYENTDAVGWKRRQLTLCIQSPVGTLRCRVTVPISFESWAGHAPNDGFAATDGVIVTRREKASAIAVPRRDGSLRLTLRSGTWLQLYGGAWLSPDPAGLPSSDVRSVVR